MKPFDLQQFLDTLPGITALEAGKRWHMPRLAFDLAALIGLA
jgi:hypothetical protein